MAMQLVTPSGEGSCCARGGAVASQAQPGPHRWRGVVQGVLAIGVMSGLVGFAVPWIAAARESHRLQTCRANLRHIGTALEAYEQRWGTLPPSATYGPDGQPLLSWRVAILPELGFLSLYEEFRQDEPWDGPHNRRLLARMPEVYRCPASTDRSDTTGYLGLHGPQAMFDGREGVPIASVTDGTSNTLVVVEAARGVPWTRPLDHEYAPLVLSSPEPSPLPAFGSRHEGGFLGLFRDGAARLLRPTLREETLRAIITRDGGEAIGEA